MLANGKMDASMRVNTKTIRRVDRVFSLGLMGDHMTELGPMESRTVKVLIQVAQDRREEECGQKEIDNTGSNKFNLLALHRPRPSKLS